MSGRVKAVKRGASQPPAAEPAAKKDKAPKRISLLDLALTFETMLDSNHVLDLATICYNEIMDAGEMVQEGVIRMAELFIYMCAFIQFYLNDPDANMFFISAPKGSGKKKSSKKDSDDDDDDDDDESSAKPPRMLSGTGAEDFYGFVNTLDTLAVEVFAKSQTLFKTDAEKNTIHSAMGTQQQFMTLYLQFQVLKASAPLCFDMPKSQIKNYPTLDERQTRDGKV